MRKSGTQKNFASPAPKSSATAADIPTTPALDQKGIVAEAFDGVKHLLDSKDKGVSPLLSVA
ncbi:hypothetical protein JCM31598_09050 [Desulfonatronum parangueonense]